LRHINTQKISLKKCISSLITQNFALAQTAVFDVQCFGTVLTSEAFNFGQSHVIFDWCGLIRYFYWRSFVVSI